LALHTESFIVDVTRPLPIILVLLMQLMEDLGPLHGRRLLSWRVVMFGHAIFDIDTFPANHSDLERSIVDHFEDQLRSLGAFLLVGQSLLSKPAVEALNFIVLKVFAQLVTDQLLEHLTILGMQLLIFVRVYLFFIETWGNFVNQA
jgi:hypothetical protein